MGTSPVTSYWEDFACAQEISPQGNPPQEKVTAMQVHMVEATTGKLPTVGISRVKVSSPSGRSLEAAFVEISCVGIISIVWTLHLEASNAGTS